MRSRLRREEKCFILAKAKQKINFQEGIMKVRKKSTRFIALGLVVLQVLLAIGCVSAYADDGVVARSYDIYRTDAS